MKLKSIHEIIVDEMYMFMKENINKEDYYKYETIPPFHNSYWKFTSIHGIENRIRLLKYMDQKKNKEYYEIKFGIYNENTGVISFDKPPENDHKVFNTHVKIAVDEILKNRPEIDEYRLPIVDEDSRRARLYMMAINKYLDKNEWSVAIDDKNTIYLRRGNP